MSDRFIRDMLVTALAFVLLLPTLPAQDLPKLEEALKAIDPISSSARQRLMLRKVIREVQKAIEVATDQPERWPLLELQFRAQQKLVKIDEDPKHRADILDTCRELVNAPDDFAMLRLKSDLLLSQIEQAKKGNNLSQRAKALRLFVDRYIGTAAGPEAIKTAIPMAREFGDSALIADLRQIIQVHYAADHEMIHYQKEQFPGEVFAAPFAGLIKSSDGKLMRFPMDAFGTSSFVLFWSKEGEGLQQLQRLAAASVLRGDMDGRLNILSCNLDDLEDAGESIVRGLGMNWPCLHLPGGRENHIFKVYGGNDPFLLRLSATAQAAIFMGGVRRNREDGSANYENTLNSYMARKWTKPVYSSQLRALSAGEFLIFDPLKGDSALPASIQPIQACFVAPPMRHQLSHQDQVANYRKAVDLCRKAIVTGSNDGDLWRIRDRLIVALMGLWKTEGDLAHLEASFVEAEAAMNAGYPSGADLIARFCLARQALRNPQADGGVIIDNFITESSASGPALAAACFLALDIADRLRFEQARDLILKQHTEEPEMWLIASFLLDRHHSYWMHQVPYTFGWIYDRREGHFITDGNSEPSRRMLSAELLGANGKPFQIPQDLTTDTTVIVFASAPPWSTKRDDGLPPSPERTLQTLLSLAQERPKQDLQVCVAFIDDKAYGESFTGLAKHELSCTMLAVPGGDHNSVVHRLGATALDQGLGGVILAKDGRILKVVSGLSPTSMRIGGIMENTVRRVMSRRDELKVLAIIEKGEVEAAKKLILTLAPHQDPDAVDDKGRSIKYPTQAMSHLRARARVHAAMKDWGKAHADAELICQRRARMDADMSRLSSQLGRDQVFRDEMKAKLDK